MRIDILRVLARAATVLVVTSGATASVQAQSTYPNKPVRIIVPSTPAGVLDNVARTLALRLAEQLGQPIVIDNKGGAGGNIGTQAFVRDKADGYSMILATS